MKRKHVLIRHGCPIPHTEYKITFTFWSYACHKLLGHVHPSWGTSICHSIQMHKNGSNIDIIDW